MAKPNEADACVGLNGDGKILSATWMFMGEPRQRITSVSEAVSFCQNDEVEEIKWLTEAEFKDLADSVGWAF